MVETVSEHIFWKYKDMAEETRSANVAVAAFVKVGEKRFVFVSLKNLFQSSRLLALGEVWVGVKGPVHTVYVLM